MIRAKMFGSPYVMMDDKKIKFPFMKAEALFYYLIYNKRATRDELVALFWCDNDEKNAKKNLRNAIYKLKKAFDTDIIISPQKSTVYVNEEIEYSIDIDKFHSDDLDSYEAYQGEFLQGFIVKNAEGFNNWADALRQELKETYISKLNAQMDEYFEADDLKGAEKILKMLINEDEYEEMNYRLLITLYKNQGSYVKALDLFEKLKIKLNTNLGVEPSDETKKLIDKIPMLKKDKDIKDAELFLGRYRELNKLYENYISYNNDRDYKHFLLRGEAGIGKTALKKQFLNKVNQGDLLVLQSNCYQDEYDYFFKPWNGIFNGLNSYLNTNNIVIPMAWKKVVGRLFPSFLGESNEEINNRIDDIDIVKFEVIQNTIIKLFNKILKNKRVLIIFEDVHWMNETSMRLLLAILHNCDVLFVGTARNERTDGISKLKGAFKKDGLMEILDISRFDSGEIDDFIDAYATNGMDIRDRLTIGKETEGNPFYLKEYLDIYNEKGKVVRGLSSRMEDVIGSKFMTLSPKQKKIVEIISIFFDKAPLNLISRILSEDELEVIEEIEELSNLNIVNEMISDEIGYGFSHQKLREYVYNNLMVGKKRLLHNKIGYYIEESMKQSDKSSEVLTNIIYHYTNAKNHKKRAEYIIKYLDTYLYVQDELYPVNNISINSDVFKFNREDVVKYFDDIDETLGKIDANDEELINLKIMYYHLKGRYLIKIGSYNDGIDIIKEMIDMAMSIGYHEYAVKGYRQKIYYAVQVNDLGYMKVNIDAGLDVIEGNELVEDEAIFLRLKGLYHLLSRDYEEAEKNLGRAIELFQSIGDGYNLNIAACYNYIGGVRRHQCRYEEAMDYYNRAMAICKENGIIRGLTIFNTNAGIAAYDSGDREEAKRYFNAAIRIYNKFDILWRRSIAEGYLGLLEVEDGNNGDGFEHIEKAISYMNTIKNPIEILTIKKIIRILKTVKANDSNVLNRLDELLNNFNI